MADGLITPGMRAPDFTLPIGPTQSVSLHDYRGRPVVLAFYPADWSPVCGEQMTLYQAATPMFQRYDAQVLGISVDSGWCHLAFASDRRIEFPLVADFEPKGGVARAYGVYREQDGTSERALFVIDPEGVVRWSYVSPIDVNPGCDGVLRALEEMQAEVRG